MNAGVLALDQGSHASRACVFGSDGALLAVASVPVATQHPDTARVEQDADELAASLQSAAQSALSQARQAQPGLTLAAAGLAVQRSTVVCCDRASGAPLAPAISWQDRRHAAWLATLAAHEARVRELTGLPLSPHYGASKLRWSLAHQPQVARAAAAGRLLAAPLASFLAMRLAGAAPLADPANASRTLLFDSQRLDWSDELLQLFAIERAWLPRCAPTRGAWGRLRLGMSAGAGAEAIATPLRAVTGDQSAVPYAAGEPAADTVYVNLGTGAFVQRPVPTRPPSPAPLLGSVLGSDDSGVHYSIEGTVNGAGSAVSWFCAEERCEEAPLWAALDAVPAQAPLPLFVNGIGGLGSPWWRAEAAPRFVGDGDRLARFAAVIESIAFMIAANAQWLARLAGPPRRVLLAGGMSRSAWLCQRLANLLALPLQRLESEASARGVARLAAPEIAARWPAGATAPWTPRPDAALLERYRQFRAAVD